MNSDLWAIFTHHAASAFAKQLHLDDLVGELDWHVDLGSGCLSFGDRYRWQTQVLGTASEINNSWLWAWANPSGIAPELLQAALALRDFGEQHGITELVEAQLPLAEIDGHFLALLASGLLDAGAYYRAPYEGGAAFLLITDERFPRCSEPPLGRIASVFPQALAALDIPNHKIALAGYLESCGLAFESEPARIVVKEKDEPVLMATFDEQERLTHLEVTLRAEEPPPLP